MRKTLTVLIAATALLGGCGQGESGVAQPVAERWDPCSIPKDAIAATGLDPGYMDVGWSDGIVVKDWSRCRFRAAAPAPSPSYFLNILSSDVHTVADARGNGSYLDGVDIKVDNRDAFQYRTGASRSVMDCSVAVDMGLGVTVFDVNFTGPDETGANACDIARGHAANLEKLLPSTGG